MTRILVQRGSSSNRPSLPSSSSSASTPTHSLPVGLSPTSFPVREDEPEKDVCEVRTPSDEVCDGGGSGDEKSQRINDFVQDGSHINRAENEGDEVLAVGFEKSDECASANSEFNLGLVTKDLSGVQVATERCDLNEVSYPGSTGSSQLVQGSSYPPPPPVPPPKPSASFGVRRTGSGGFVRIGSSRRSSGWPVVPTRTSPSGSRPTSPRSHVDGEGYNSADEQGPCFGSSYDDVERERQFELEIRRVKGLEVRRMTEDGNCLFRAVADQVYGDAELYDLARQMCIDYMERERDHFSQFITEGFTSYCKRKRRDKVYGNNVEIQALSEMYNRPIHIYCYSTEPINIFHGSYTTDTPPIRLSYHHGNHYNSLVDPRRLTIGAGLGFSNLQGTNIDKDQIKAAIRAQQDQQIDNALLAEGRFYSDLELTEKEIERMVMEASRAEYLANNKFKQPHASRGSSTSSGAEPSSSGAGPLVEESKLDGGIESRIVHDTVLSSSIQMLLSMGFSYLQAVEAYSIFGDDVDSMVCYLLEMGGSGPAVGSKSRRKGKATE
ncbi:OTU domain-containing protein 5 [Nymphaea thermarum]|nr:OTU domain-containing protein 5 [Nymphaea thermarum]